MAKSGEKLGSFIKATLPLALGGSHKYASAEGAAAYSLPESANAAGIFQARATHSRLKCPTRGPLPQRVTTCAAGARTTSLSTPI